MLYVIDRETRKIVLTTKSRHAAFKLATRLECEQFGQSGHFGRYGVIDAECTPAWAPDAAGLREFCASW